MPAKRPLTLLAVLCALAYGSVLTRTSCAQDSTGRGSWSSSTQQADPAGATNPFRTTTTHTQMNGRTIEKTVVEARGPDGRYVPYSVTERESLKVNDTTTRTVERSFATNTDGRQTLTQERRGKHAPCRAAKAKSFA
jgi:hypothetical protein